MTGTWVQVCVLLLGLGLTDGFLFYTNTICDFNSTDPSDIEYSRSYVYNKMELIRFWSEWGKFVGFTEFGVKTAENWNKDPAILNRMRAQKDTYCVPSVQIFYSNILSKSAEPYAVLNTAPSAGSERVLVCSVYGFYPKHITVSWTNHHQPIKTGVTTTDLLPDSDWYYQVHSHLEYSPRSGDLISCVVEHVSLKEPLVLDWDGSMSKEDKDKIGIGVSCLVLGLVCAVAGFIYYKTKPKDAESCCCPSYVLALVLVLVLVLVLFSVSVLVLVLVRYSPRPGPV